MRSVPSPFPLPVASTCGGCKRHTIDFTSTSTSTSTIILISSFLARAPFACSRSSLLHTPRSLLFPPGTPPSFIPTVVDKCTDLPPPPPLLPPPPSPNSRLCWRSPPRTSQPHLEQGRRWLVRQPLQCARQGQSKIRDPPTSPSTEDLLEDTVESWGQSTSDISIR